MMAHSKHDEEESRRSKTQKRSGSPEAACGAGRTEAEEESESAVWRGDDDRNE